MTIKMNSRQKDDVLVLDLYGRLVLGESTIALREQIRDLVARGQKKIVLNLRDVPYIDSSGLGELVGAFTAVRRQGGELKLVNLAKHVHGLLQMTKLYTVFEVYDDEETALRSCA